MNNVLRKVIICLFLVMVLINPVFPQESKDIKMEVFEKDGKILPFSAVITGNRAVTDLEKKDLVLLLNGRNFRDFTLVYPSTLRKVPALADTPSQSGYDIIFPYTPELYATQSIQLGTTRPGVRLQTVDTITINRPRETAAEQTETMTGTPVQSEPKVIQVKIIELDSQGHQIGAASPAGGVGISTAEGAGKALPTKSLESENPFFKERLVQLGVPGELLEDPSFFQVALQSLGIEKNMQGYWEIVFNDGITMIYIPAGEFVMGVPWDSGGADDESPLHNVFLDGCWISKYEITFDQYDRFCLETGRSQMYDYGRGRKNHPVIGVTWQDCQDFCQWLSLKTGAQFRLPTEAEWEKAARGTKPREYPWGDQKPDGKLANFADVRFLKKYLKLNPPLDEEDRKQKTDWIDPSIDDGNVYTAPVGSYKAGASPYGVMDMAGNVWEWVMDWYDDDYYQRSPGRNPQRVGVGSYRVSRGGGWDCHPWLLRSTGRAGCDPNLGNDALGFRVVCTNAQ